MEVSSEQSGEGVASEKPLSSPKKNVPEASRRAAKAAADPGGAAKRKIEPRSGSSTGSGAVPARRSGSIGGSASSVTAPRRNSTGGLSQKSSISAGGRKADSESVAGGKSSVSSANEPVRKSLPELQRGSVTSSRAGAAAKPAAVSLVDSASKSARVRKAEVARKPALSASASASSVSRRISSSSMDSTASSGGSTRRTVSRVSSPTVSSGLKAGSLSMSQDRASVLSGRRKGGTPDSRDSRFIVLPHVEIKANDDLNYWGKNRKKELYLHSVKWSHPTVGWRAQLPRLDLRGHRVRNLTASGLNLSSNLEFVYLRDNLLSTLEGVEILSRVKVLDLSFNDFKGPGFEPLENCKVLQFLSVAQNKLKSLTMASQPRLQVLAASKNKISTLKGFPYLPVLEHLRVEENPILKMPHLEAASILLVGPTLKKYNDRDLSREEVALAKRYPAQTALCIRAGWEFSRPEQAAESTFRFLVEQWKDHIPPGFLLKEASIDKPVEQDVCRCHFTIIHDGAASTGPPLVLKYQWFCGDLSLSNFVPIPDATDEWNSSPVVIVGAEDEEYQLNIDDVDSSLVFMYTPVTEEGAKGEPQYKYTDFVKAALLGVGCAPILATAIFVFLPICFEHVQHDVLNPGLRSVATVPKKPEIAHIRK
ncbi:unnamed protein product [Sphenostylis stenocarpa]|uniref:AIR9-like A9 domain-containing protein n=1 Tax=Sphenostylis stenocarpa TaxID=92480 RepID=A0AA86SZ11_9FABA|nr:unnamed protein product [Sphenostylis stenocarpa]